METTTFTRRGIVAGAAMLGVASLAAGMPVALADVADNWDKEADVVVCGAGTAGVPCAIEAFDNGADVLIIEKMDWTGGCMRRCAGGFLAAGTLVQEKLGVDDDPELLEEYLVACAQGYCDEELVHALAYNSAEDFNWIITPVEEGGLGGQPLEEWEFTNPDDDEELFIAPGLNLSGTPIYYEDFDCDDCKRLRCHWFNPNPDDVDPGDRYYADYDNNGLGWKGRGGTGLWKPFAEALDARGIEVMTETCLRSLVLDDDGRVVGVVAETAEGPVAIKARKGVMLATGAWVNEPDLYFNLTGTAYAEPSDTQKLNGGFIPEMSQGEGLKAALKAGAAPAFTFLGRNGGVKIDANCQVIDTDGQPIAGLYAGGRTSGGVFSSVYPACGAFVGSAVSEGRIAGRCLAGGEAWA